MIGKLLGTAIRVATLPLDAVNIATDMMGGGNGSKRSRTGNDFDPIGDLESIRDRIAEAAESIDD